MKLLQVECRAKKGYLNLSILRELVMDVILLRLFVDPGDEEDPPLNAPLRSWLSYLLSLYSLILTLPTTNS